MIKYTSNIYKGIDYKNDVIKLGSDFEKIAYDASDATKEFIDNLKPNADTHYFLVNSLGAGEIYGPNSRGDFFPFAQLEKHANSFMTSNAKTYHSHINKDPNLSLGDVLFANFNTDNGRVELIQTVENSKLDRHAPQWVKDYVKSGEAFPTSMGCFPAGTRITTLNGYKNIEDIVEGDIVLTHKGVYRRVKGTFKKFFDEGIYNLKIRARSPETMVTHEHPFWTVTKEDLINGIHEAKWVKTQHLVSGDFISYVFDDTIEDFKIDKNILFLLGAFLVTGFISKSIGNKAIELTFRIKDRDTMLEFGKIAGEAGAPVIGRVKSKKRKGGKGKYFDVKVRGDEFVSKIMSNLELVNDKYRLKEFLMKLTPSKQLHILDGAKSARGSSGYRGECRIRTANSEGLNQLRQIACRNRLVWTTRKVGWTSLYREHGGYTWELVLPADAAKEPMDITDSRLYFRSFKDAQNTWPYFYLDNCYFSEIKLCELNKNWSGFIYNFEVEEDESYVANDIVVHNCKVEKEACSYCGGEFKRIYDRCEHLKFAMNNFIDGSQVYAVNYTPNFFDNSIVKRPADKIARSIQKIASEFNPEETILRELDLRTPSRKYFFFNSGEKHDIDIDSLYSIKEASFSKEYLSELVSEYPLSNILGTFKEAGIVPYPHEYQYILLNSIGEEKLANEYWDQKTVFNIPERYEKEKVLINSDEKLANDISDYIPLRSKFDQFEVYRSLVDHISKEATQIVKPDFIVNSNELFREIGNSYVNYLMEKNAGVLETFILGVFLSLPELIQLKKLESKNNKLIEENMFRLKNSSDKSSIIPLLPSIPNPVIKTASKKQTLKNIASVAGKLAPAAAGAGTALYIKGINEQRKITGDPKADKGFVGTAAKYPIVTALGGTGLAYLLKNKVKAPFKKKANDEFIDQFKDNLINFENQDLVSKISKISDDLLLELIN